VASYEHDYRPSGSIPGEFVGTCKILQKRAGSAERLLASQVVIQEVIQGVVRVYLTYAIQYLLTLSI
jgi:hypothetical protein